MNDFLNYIVYAFDLIITCIILPCNLISIVNQLFSKHQLIIEDYIRFQTLVAWIMIGIFMEHPFYINTLGIPIIQNTESSNLLSVLIVSLLITNFMSLLFNFMIGAKHSNRKKYIKYSFLSVVVGFIIIICMIETFAK